MAAIGLVIKAYDQSKAVLLPSHSVSERQSFLWVLYIVPLVSKILYDLLFELSDDKRTLYPKTWFWPLTL